MRYARQEIMKEIGKDGQKKLRDAQVAIVGVGALGCTVSELLARAGIGKLILIDKDLVEEVNLHRQSLFGEQDIDKPKASLGAQHLKSINSTIEVTGHNTLLDSTTINLLDPACLIIDCTDNLETRFLINDYCLQKGKKWVYGAATDTHGYVRFMDGACLRCFLTPTDKLNSCSEVGVLNALTSIIGSMQAALAIRCIVTGSAPSALIKVDAWNLDIEKLNITPKDDCICRTTS